MRILLQTSLIKRILNGFRQAYYIGLQSKLFIFKETISILAKEKFVRHFVQKIFDVNVVETERLPLIIAWICGGKL